MQWEYPVLTFEEKKGRCHGKIIYKGSQFRNSVRRREKENGNTFESAFTDDK